MALQWLYDYHPNGKESLLVDTMQRIKNVSTNWRDVMSEAKFPKTAVSEFRIYWHGMSNTSLLSYPNLYWIRCELG